MNESSSSGDSYCLEWQNATSHVGVSDCYPNSSPVTNRDKDQQWVLNDDATIRPVLHPALCLTNDRLVPETEWLVYNVSVVECDGRVEQHWTTDSSADWEHKTPTPVHSNWLSFATEVSIGLV
jgi:hypothetical protein